MIIESLLHGADTSTFFPVRGLVCATVYVKCEALNVTGSIKIKPALRMIDDLERSQRLCTGGTLIESSSGNFGIAVSFVAASRGYRFICIVDPNTSVDSVNTMRALGTEVIVVEKKDANGGYLGTRIEFIKEMCATHKDIVWINQYANECNWRAHFETTAREILTDFPVVDHLFIGSGTGGTLMGCARYFREKSPSTHIIAVDAEGSVAFGGPSKTRKIPGIGTSRKPEILDDTLIDSVVHVPELDTISMCRALAKGGLLVGGSTGTVLAGVRNYSYKIKPSDIVIAIMPDFGFKYLDTIYSDDWVERHYGSLRIIDTSATT